MKVCVTEKKKKKQRGNRLENPCIVTIKISEHMYVKIETIIKDMCGGLVQEDKISKKKYLFSCITL